MKQLTAVIERAENNFSAYIRELDGVTATGLTIDEIKASIVEAVDILVEECKEDNCPIPEILQGEYDLIFEIDVQSFLMIYEGIFTKSGLERMTGINQKQLWHYSNGTKPRPAQRMKLQNALHKLGEELLAIQL